MNPGALPALATAEDVAAVLALTPRTVRALARRGELPHVRIGRTLRFDPAAVAAWVDARRVESAPPPPRRGRPSRAVVIPAGLEPER